MLQYICFISSVIPKSRSKGKGEGGQRRAKRRACFQAGHNLYILWGHLLRGYITTVFNIPSQSRGGREKNISAGSRISYWRHWDHRVFITFSAPPCCTCMNARQATRQFLCQGQQGSPMTKGECCVLEARHCAGSGLGEGCWGSHIIGHCSEDWGWNKWPLERSNVSGDA